MGIAEQKPDDTTATRSAGQKAAVDVVAGAAAGAFARTLVAPVDRVKLMVQLRGSVSSATASGDAASSSPLRGTGAWDVGRKIIRDEGVLALWRGNTPTLLIQAGTSALNFMFMDCYQNAASRVLAGSSHGDQSMGRKSELLSSFISGGLAGGTTITVLYPLGFMRTRLAMDVGASSEARMYPRGMRDVVASIMKTDGPRGFYQGYGIALASVTLYRTVYLGGYDSLKRELICWQNLDDGSKTAGGGTKDLPLTQRFVAAQFVSGMASIVHYPLDSVRRRLMMQAGRPKEERMYRTSIDCFRKIYVCEGVRGYFLGLAPNLVRSTGAALVLVLFDEFKSVLLSKL